VAGQRDLTAQTAAPLGSGHTRRRLAGPPLLIQRRGQPDLTGCGDGLEVFELGDALDQRRLISVGVDHRQRIEHVCESTWALRQFGDKGFSPGCDSRPNIRSMSDARSHERRSQRRRWFTRTDFLARWRRAQADFGMRDDLATLASDTTDDLGPIR
jgi:hypothetical protein